MSQALPLLAQEDPRAVLAWRAGHAVRVAEFLADAHRVAQAMPEGGHVLNACHDRYRVAVGFAAAVLRGKINLLPSTRTADAIRRLREALPDLFALVDGPSELDLPRMRYPEAGRTPAPRPGPMPHIRADRVVAKVCTSGSTGAPLPHDKTWGSLVACIGAGRERLGLPPGTTLVGTVPAQHMYGFESTLLMALHGGLALSGAHPFYPADIVEELARVPEPRMLVSTPVHLRALLSSGLDIPRLAMVLCATAPLAAGLARDIEARTGAPLVEIYGSTETGQIATRRTARTEAFTLLRGVELVPVSEGLAMARGGHLLAPTPMHDLIEPLGGGDFLLHGRSADMVNVAGKRSSLAHLNHQLCSIPGVLDGAFFAPERGADDVVGRLMAFAVAPQWTPQALRQALRERIEPAFLPRPLVLLRQLPRNATGKLPHAALAALAARHGESVEACHDAR
jgi:acyl-coenzyme A synthetase/AMP-(fatty) acid ligase